MSLFFLGGPRDTPSTGVARKTSEEPERTRSPSRRLLLEPAMLVVVSIILTYVVVVLGR